MISAHDNKTIYYGGNHLFKSADRGDTWQRLGPDLTTAAERDTLQILGKTVDKDTLSRHDGVVSWPCITVIAESPVKAGVLWAGTDDGNVQVSRDDGKTWTNVFSKMPGAPKGGYVSRIEASWKEEGTAYVAFDNHRSADFAVYLYLTKDFGATWTKITNGIPEDAGTVHVVREDPANSNLLFAGTEFGLWVSFDRGSNWQRMKNGLPTTPVFDLQIHPREHDLIVATHGRSIWIMDNIRPLEELSDSVLSTDLKLFSSPPAIQWKRVDAKGFVGSKLFLAPNPPAGVILDYYAKGRGAVTVTVKDQGGATVRTLNAQAQPGINRTTWDMRYDPPIAMGGRGGGGGRGGAGGGRGGAAGAGGGGRGGRGATAETPATAEEPASETAGAAGGGGGGGRGGRGGGASVDPGDFTVTIAQSGKTDSKTVTVQEDPRINISAGDRAKRRQAITRLVSMTKEADQGRRKIVAIQTALTTLTDGWKRPGAPAIPDPIKKAADDLLARAKAAAGKFEAERQQPAQLGAAGAPLTYTPPPVTQKIMRLASSIDGYMAAPTSRQMSDMEDAAAQLKEGLAAVESVAGEVPKLNKMMAEAGIPYFTIDTTNVPPPTGGRGGER